MIWRLLADAVLLLHAAFVLFVVFGGLWALRRRGVMFLHVPAAIWGVLIEWIGWICPLTPLENWLRRAGGEAGYTSSFIEHYLLPWIYPDELSRELQWLLGGFVLLFNGVVYFVYWRRYRQRGAASRSSSS